MFTCCKLETAINLRIISYLRLSVKLILDMDIHVPNPERASLENMCIDFIESMQPGG